MVRISLQEQRTQSKQVPRQKTEDRAPKQAKGFGLVEVLIILGMLAVLELNLMPFFLKLVCKNEQTQVAETGKMFSHQVGFMQTRARYQGHMLLLLCLAPQGSEYDIVDAFRVKKNIMLSSLSLSCVNLMGPLKLSFFPVSLDGPNATYTVASSLIPSYSKHIRVQPVTGRLVMSGE
jgi:hypothetical protein